jgi:hypothetical protein
MIWDEVRYVGLKIETSEWSNDVIRRVGTVRNEFGNLANTWERKRDAGERSYTQVGVEVEAERDVEAKRTKSETKSEV